MKVLVATRQVPKGWFDEWLPLIGDLAEIVRGYFNDDTAPETLIECEDDPRIWGLSQSPARLVLASGCMPNVFCYSIFEYASLRLPPTITKFRLEGIYAQMELDLSSTRLHNFHASWMQSCEWIGWLNKCRSIEFLRFEKVEKGGQVLLGGEFPALKELTVNGLSDSVSLEPGADLTDLFIANVSSCTSVKGISGLHSLSLHSISGDYDLSGFPSTLRSISLTKISPSALSASPVSIPEYIESLEICKSGKSIRYIGTRATGLPELIAMHPINPRKSRRNK